MNPDDVWQDWLSQRRQGSPPENLADRVMAGINAPLARPAVSPRGWLRPLIPYVLGTAAAVVCAARIYSVLSVVMAPVAVNIEDAEESGTSDEQLTQS